jgi:OST-HTH/LOTUS domain
MPLVERALQVLERREVRPQLGLLKSTMLQLDSSFSERAYGASSFTDFVEKLRKNDYVIVTGGEGRYMIQRKHGGATEKLVRPEGALPVLRDVLESHRLEMEDGVLAEELLGFVKEEQPNFDWKNFGFQEFSELLNFAQDKGVTRIEPDEEKGIMVYLGAEFHPPAIPDAPVRHQHEPEEERQPVVKGQPTAREPRVKRTPRKTAARVPSLATSLPVDDDDATVSDMADDEFETQPFVAEPEADAAEADAADAAEVRPEPVEVAAEVVAEPVPAEPEPAPATTKRARKLPTRRTSKKKTVEPQMVLEEAPAPADEEV